MIKRFISPVDNLLNYYIDSSIQGKDDPEAFAEKMNTNTLIAEIGNAISMALPKEAIKPDQYGNPLNFYASIISFLQRSPVGLVKLWPKKFPYMVVRKSTPSVRNSMKL